MGKDWKGRLITLLSILSFPIRMGLMVQPKGGWDNDETCEEAALRETWEEGEWWSMGGGQAVEKMTCADTILPHL